MKQRFAGKVAVVTGASSGVGRAIAQAFGREGARVALLARNEEALVNAAAEVERLGGEALVLPTDVGSAEQVEAAAARVQAKWGRIDYWVNDAMVSVFSPAHQMSMHEFDRVTQVNYLGTVYGTLAALRRMRAQGDGYILQIGSALAYCSIPLQSAYCATKAAVRGFTDSLRVELLHDKSPVRVGMIQLPAVNTPQFQVVRSRMPGHPQPVPPIYQPEVIARAALYACAHRSRELWVGGSAIKAILGQFFVRRFVDWYLARTGYASQQSKTLPPKPNEDNLFAPLPGDRGAHGEFDAQARSFDPESWLRQHWALPVAAGALVAAGLAASKMSGRRVV